MQGPQDLSGSGASLTIKAEKPPFFGTLATEKQGSPLTVGKKHLPTDYEKGLEMNKYPWAKHLFAENRKKLHMAGCPQAIPWRGIGKSFRQFDLWFWG